MNNLTNGDVPMGLGMALAQNLEAMSYFSNLPKEQQQAVIDSTHNIQSKEEMRAFVESLAANRNPSSYNGQMR